MKETIILEKVKVGDASAFSLLYDLYWLKVYNFARLYITSSSCDFRSSAGCFRETLGVERIFGCYKKF